MSRLAEHNFTFNDIFEEVPITLSSSVLGQGFIASFAKQNQLQDQYEQFDLSTNDFMQKNLEVCASWRNTYSQSLSYCFSDLQREQVNYGNWSRTVAKVDQQQQQFIQQRVRITLFSIS